MPGLTDIQVAQKACGLVGIDPITSFSDASAEAVALDVTYEPLIEGELGIYPWRFASSQVALDRLSDEPLARWGAAYQIPTDCIAVQAVLVADDTIEFDRYANYIYCDATENDTVVLDYTFRQVEAQWPGFFTLGIIYKLASVLAASVQERATLAETLEAKGSDWLTKAGHRDSVGRTARKIKLNRLKAGRRGR